MDFRSLLADECDGNRLLNELPPFFLLPQKVFLPATVQIVQRGLVVVPPQEVHAGPNRLEASLDLGGEGGPGGVEGLEVGLHDVSAHALVVLNQSFGD